MSDYEEISKKEKAFLKNEEEKDPSLFKSQEIIDDEKTLKKFGFNIVGKENFPKAFLKKISSDFIVEEISKDQQIKTVDFKENIEQIENEKWTSTTLVKCNISTFDAISDLSKQLEIDQKKISFAGIKDNNAITAQELVIKTLGKEIKSIKNQFYFTKDFASRKTPLASGELWGNRFSILLREIEPVDEIIFKERIEKIKNDGVLNYYYTQRFGSPRFLSPKLGMLLLKKEYEQVVKTSLFGHSDSELKYFSQLRQKASEIYPDLPAIKKLYENFPKILRIENTLLDHLIKNPADYLGAFEEIKDQIQMWIYAFVSLMFNFKISQDSSLEKTPLCLTGDPKVHNFYSDIYKIINFDPKLFENAKVFPFIRLQNRDVETKIHPNIINQKNIAGLGTFLQFDLPKGAYATTFLSNIFNLVSSNRNNQSETNIIDVKKELGDTDQTEILKIFEKNLLGQ